MQDAASNRLPARIRRLLPRLLLALASTLGTLLLVESILRVSEPHIVQHDAEGRRGMVDRRADAMTYPSRRGRRMLPDSDLTIHNHPISGRDVRITTNRLGFRDAELPQSKLPDELRILALGDSITIAHYLPAEESWVERAERRLDAALPTRRVSLINAGVPDIGLEEAIDILAETGLLSEPDWVLLAFYLNDSRPPWGFPEELRGRGWLRRHSLLAERIYTDLRRRQWLREVGEDRFAWATAVADTAWQREPEAFRELTRLARYDWGAAWQADSWDAVERQFDRLADLTAPKGVGVAVVVFPVAYQTFTPFVDDAPQREMATRVAARGWPLLDLLPLLRESAPGGFFDQCHPDGPANDRIGAAVAAFLEEQVERAPEP